MQHSADRRQIERGTVRGKLLHGFLAILFDAYWSGRPVCRTITALSDAGFSEKTNSLSKAFSGRTDWQSFIKYDEGNCWIEAPPG